MGIIYYMIITRPFTHRDIELTEGFGKAVSRFMLAAFHVNWLYSSKPYGKTPKLIPFRDETKTRKRSSRYG
jgi:hypothetical protein